MKKMFLMAFMVAGALSLGFGNFAECIENCKQNECSRICDGNSTEEECISECKENNHEITSKCHHECKYS